MSCGSENKIYWGSFDQIRQSRLHSSAHLLQRIVNAGRTLSQLCQTKPVAEFDPQVDREIHSVDLAIDPLRVIEATEIGEDLPRISR